jgi:hypothetical protein
VARLAWLASCMALALAGCGAPTGRPGQHSAGPSGPGSPPGAAQVWCAGAWLRIRAGREGGQGASYGFIEFTNVGSRPCALRGLPRVALVKTGGKSLPVRQARAPDLSFRPIVLPPGRPDPADLVVSWVNWCGPPPGLLSVRITLPSGGVVTGPFNGPPDYDFVPPCLAPGQPSTISVTDAYQPALAG